MSVPLWQHSFHVWINTFMQKFMIDWMLSLLEVHQKLLFFHRQGFKFLWRKQGINLSADSTSGFLWQWLCPLGNMATSCGVPRKRMEGRCWNRPAIKWKRTIRGNRLFFLWAFTNHIQTDTIRGKEMGKGSASTIFLTTWQGVQVPAFVCTKCMSNVLTQCQIKNLRMQG